MSIQSSVILDACSRSVGYTIAWIVDLIEIFAGTASKAVGSRAAVQCIRAIASVERVGAAGVEYA